MPHTDSSACIRGRGGGGQGWGGGGGGGGNQNPPIMTAFFNKKRKVIFIGHAI